MPLAKWNPHDWLSRIFAGGAFGCVALFIGELAISFPPAIKGDKRWDVYVWAAEVGLPAAFGLGALVGLAWRRSREFRLTILEFTVCNWMVAILSVFLIPSICRIGPAYPRPLYQVVPQCMTFIFGLLALTGTVWVVARHVGRCLRSLFCRSEEHGELFPSRGDPQ
jgi:hypothetical protein